MNLVLFCEKDIVNLIKSRNKKKNIINYRKNEKEMFSFNTENISFL